MAKMAPQNFEQFLQETPEGMPAMGAPVILPESNLIAVQPHAKGGLYAFGAFMLAFISFSSYQKPLQSGRGDKVPQSIPTRFLPSSVLPRTKTVLLVQGVLV